MPLLPSIYAFTAQQTVMLSLLIVLFVVLTNTFFFLKQKLVDFHLFWLIAPSSILGSLIFVYVGSLISDFILRLTLLFVLILTLINPFQLTRIQKNLVSGGTFGFLIGALAATVGIGMTILSPILYQSSWTRTEKISPTANAIMAFNAFFTIIVLFLRTPKNFEWPVSLSVVSIIVPMALLSSTWGRKWNLKNPKRTWIFYIILICLILKVIDELFGIFVI